MKRELDPSENLLNLVHVTHEITAYGLSDPKWTAYLLYLVNKSEARLTLLTVAKGLVKELETKIAEVELMMTREKKTLTPLGMKETKVYLLIMKTDRFKNKALANCFSTSK